MKKYGFTKKSYVGNRTGMMEKEGLYTERELWDVKFSNNNNLINLTGFISTF